ncbi:mCG20944, isoform CRA_a, partial [Mus musculus]
SSSVVEQPRTAFSCPDIVQILQDPASSSECSDVTIGRDHQPPGQSHPAFRNFFLSILTEQEAFCVQKMMPFQTACPPGPGQDPEVCNICLVTITEEVVSHMASVSPMSSASASPGPRAGPQVVNIVNIPGPQRYLCGTLVPIRLLGSRRTIGKDA